VSEALPTHRETDTMNISTLTVGELIERLQDFDPNSLVMVTRKSGDYWNTVCADTIGNWDVEEQEVTWSEHHRTYKVEANEYDEHEYEDGDDVGPDPDMESNPVVVTIGMQLRQQNHSKGAQS